MTTGTCVSTDVMFVCRLTSCLSTINDDWDTGTQLQRGRRGAQGGYINDDGDTGNV